MPLLSVIIGVMAGIYPAFYMSSFNPNMVLKGKMRSGKENGKLRRALVVVQFSISIILIVGTIIMYKQLNYMQKKDLGFDSDRIFVIAVLLTRRVAGNWLHNYPYRINIQVLDFLYGLLIAVIIALATISYRTIRSARMNPTRSLRYE
ncbi:MAG: hypothetical protein RQ761_04470 [Bacteroidales bacterium]|nr:hypothetical protein [Bacteroidales bacterium]